MKHLTLFILGSIIPLISNAQTADEIIKSADMQSRTEFGMGTVVQILACKSNRAGIDGSLFIQAIQKNHKSLDWRPVDYYQYADAGFEFSEAHPNQDCSQLAINMIDATY